MAETADLRWLRNADPRAEGSVDPGYSGRLIARDVTHLLIKTFYKPLAEAASRKTWRPRIGGRILVSLAGLFHDLNNCTEQNMSARIEIDDQRRRALERVARRGKVPLRQVLERAVDEFIERAEDDHLLLRSARTARLSGLREESAAEIVRRWRKKTAKKT